MDLDRVGIAGHSLGGATALQFCHDDKRCKAGIDIDGAPLGAVITKGINQPFMFLMSDQIDKKDPESKLVENKVLSICRNQFRQNKSLIKIKGANHFGFSDDGALLKSPIILSLLNFIGILGLDGHSQLAETNNALIHFFLQYLTEDEKPLLYR